MRGAGAGSARLGAGLSSKAALVNTNPPLNPAVRMAKVVPTPAKKTIALEAILSGPDFADMNASQRLKFPAGRYLSGKFGNSGSNDPGVVMLRLDLSQTAERFISLVLVW